MIGCFSPGRIIRRGFLCLCFVCILLVIVNGTKSAISASPSSPKISLLVIYPHSGAASALAEWFHAETNAVVELTTIHYGELLDRIVADNTSAQPTVDIYVSWYVDLGKLVKIGAITDLTDFIAANKSILKVDDFIPTLYNAYTLYQDRRWGLPFDGDAHVLFYRKSLLNKYQLTPPETWDDYLNVARVITQHEQKNGIYGSAIMAHPDPMTIVSSFMNRLGSYGGRLLDESNVPQLTTQAAVNALSAMVMQSAYALPTPTETDFAVARDAFLTGQVAMVEQWTDIGIMAEDVTQSLIRGDWGVVPIPRGIGPQARLSPALNAGFILALSSKAPNPSLAKEFLLFATRPDITLKLNLINGGIDPTRISILNSEAFKEFAPRLSRVEQSITQHATPWPVVPEMPALLHTLAKYLVQALEKQQTPEEALRMAQQQWLTILSNKAN